MAKEEILSKLSIKDYNNELEKILEKKSFSEGAKNLLLSMLYKVEIAYTDYTKVKVAIKSKKEIIEEIINIINNYCNDIEIIKPTFEKDTVLKDKKFIILYKEKKIITYPNETILLYALQQLNISKKIQIDEKYNIINDSVEEMFNTGYKINIAEIIRDFDGWTWNINKKEIPNITYNLIYQNVQLLLGNDFIEDMTKNIFFDNINEFESKLKEKYGEEISKKIYHLIYENSILEHIKNNQEQKKILLKEKERLNQDLNVMKDKKQYLQDLADTKKHIGKKIKKIDETLNNSKLLKEEFTQANKGLKENEKIFSLSNFEEILQTERENIVSELDSCNILMNPINYVKKKAQLEEKISLIDELQLEKNTERTQDKLKIELQKIFLEAIKINVKKFENTKKDMKEIMNSIYKMRYYNLLPINSDKQIKDIEELKEQIKQLEKELIIKAYDLKIINIFSKNIDDNLMIYSKILESNVIDLEETTIEFVNKSGNKHINIYNDNVIDTMVEYKSMDKNEQLKIKSNKKIKLFN